MHRVFYYSATGMSKLLAEKAAEELKAASPRDLLRQPLQEEALFGPDELLVLSAPVYSGRIPPTLRPSLKKLRGQNSPALLLATYGNRAYDDALLEAADALEAAGFAVIGAGAFVARHAVFPRFAVGRPDADDLAELSRLCRAVRQKLAANAPFAPGGLQIKGKRPYRKAQELPIYPTAGPKCKNCGTCAAICPVKAISPSNTKARPAKHCLACAACIHACPNGARAFRGFTYNFLDQTFRLLSALFKSPRKNPDIFV